MTTPIEPCDPRELAILRGLLASRAACVWFEGMGIGWQVFTDKRCRVLATWALQHDGQGRPPVVLEALTQAGDDKRSLLDWMEFTFANVAAPTMEERQALVDTIDSRAQDAREVSSQAEVERADRRFELARHGLAKFDEVSAACGRSTTPEGIAANAQHDNEIMQEACRELSPRWFPQALRDAATFYERTEARGADANQGLAYLDHLLLFIKGEIS